MRVLFCSLSLGYFMFRLHMPTARAVATSCWIEELGRCQIDNPSTNQPANQKLSQPPRLLVRSSTFSKNNKTKITANLFGLFCHQCVRPLLEVFLLACAPIVWSWILKMVARREKDFRRFKKNPPGLTILFKNAFEKKMARQAC